MNINACVSSKLRTSFGKWYTPHEKTPQECTYCEFCVKNGCINTEDVYKLNDAEICNCNCDCPNQHAHDCLKPYICEKHTHMYYMLTTCDMNACKKCAKMMASGSMNYCDACSAIFNVCVYCD